MLPSATQVPGVRTIPSGFPEGKPIDTLATKNADIVKLPGDPTWTMHYTYKDAGSGLRIGTATVTNAAGASVEVVGPNWFSGRLTFHIVDKVLFPSKEAAAAMTANAKLALGKAPAAAAAGRLATACIPPVST